MFLVDIISLSKYFRKSFVSTTTSRFSLYLVEDCTHITDTGGIECFPMRHLQGNVNVPFVVVYHSSELIIPSHIVQ